MKKPTLGWQLFAVWLNANCNCFLLDPITFDLAGTSLYTISEPSVIEAACFVNQMTGCKISTKFAFALGTSFSTPKDDIAWHFRCKQTTLVMSPILADNTWATISFLIHTRKVKIESFELLLIHLWFSFQQRQLDQFFWDPSGNTGELDSAVGNYHAQGSRLSCSSSTGMFPIQFHIVWAAIQLSLGRLYVRESAWQRLRPFFP